MTRIGLFSDTHSYLDDKVFKYFESCDEVWHAGDLGSIELADTMEAFKPFKAVYGNIDGGELRVRYPLDLKFDCEEVSVWMTHIGGYPGRYHKRIRPLIKENPSKLFITGHSHILKVMPDKALNLLHINPGAAGNHGFHKVKTLVRFTIDGADIKDLEVIELGQRGAIS